MVRVMPYQIPVFFACIVASGFFSGSETALIGASRFRLRRLADEGDAKAQRVLELVRDPRLVLAGILVGNNIVNILAAVMAGTFFMSSVVSFQLMIEQATQFGLFEMQFEAAGLDLGEIQDVVDDAEQTLCGAVRGLGEASLTRCQSAAEEQLGHAEHTVHRRSDFMAHGGEKFAFGLARLLCGFLGFN